MGCLHPVRNAFSEARVPMKVLRGSVESLAIVAGVVICGVVLLINVNVILRYLWGINITGVLEITEWSLLVIGLCAAPWVFWTDKHVRVDVVTSYLEKKHLKGRWYLGLGTDVIAAVVCAIVVYEAVMVTKDAFTQGLISQSFLGYKLWPFYAVIPLTFSASLAVLVSRIVRRMRNKKKWRGAPDHRAEA